MAFFDDLGKRASMTTARAMAKAQEISEISKINASISEEEKKVNAAYYQIGKLYVSLHGEEGEENFSSLVATVVECEKKISAYRDQINVIKGVQRCEKCGAEVMIGAAFCNTCGTPLPKAENIPSNDSVKCNSCGATNKTGDRFCTSCGKPMVLPKLDKQPVKEIRHCEKCGAVVEPGIKFCTTCGKSALPEEQVDVAEKSVDLPIEETNEKPVVQADVEETKCCVKCGAKISAGSAFCVECGTAVEEEEKPAEDIVVEVANKCKKCGADIETGMRFCTCCGTPVEVFADVDQILSTDKVCPKCGAKIDDDTMFCTECGTRL